MEENKNDETTCTPCEERFENHIEELVHEGEAPSTEARLEREREVRDAFRSQNGEEDATLDAFRREGREDC